MQFFAVPIYYDKASPFSASTITTQSRTRHQVTHERTSGPRDGQKQAQEQELQQQQAAWQTAMQPTYAYCKQVLDKDGNVVSPPARTKVHEIPIPGHNKTIKMYLIDGDDIVSKGLRGQHGWEGLITKFIKDRMLESDMVNLLFVDVGAHVGTHTMQVAAAGFRTLSIEAAPTNLALLRTTYCANQHMLPNLTLIGTALGNQTQNCSMWAHPINRGNGVIYCGRTPFAGLVPMGNTIIKRLDDLITEPVHVLKVDVEGFEGHVLAGASRLLSSGKVHWLVFEYVPV